MQAHPCVGKNKPCAGEGENVCGKDPQMVSVAFYDGRSDDVLQGEKLLCSHTLCHFVEGGVVIVMQMGDEPRADQRLFVGAGFPKDLQDLICGGSKSPVVNDKGAVLQADDVAHSAAAVLYLIQLGDGAFIIAACILGCGRGQVCAQIVGDHRVQLARCAVVIQMGEGFVFGIGSGKGGAKLQGGIEGVAHFFVGGAGSFKIRCVFPRLRG